jgi:peptidoglycan/xylan/chitin deacetylase (PgdA/CDA1 family)
MFAMRELGECVSLRELVQRCAVKASLPRGIVVTFDDGYADNLDIAAPLLARHDVPATVFVATAGLEEGALFWWDELEALVLLAGELRQEVSVTHHGEKLAWALTLPTHSDMPGLERGRVRGAP